MKHLELLVEEASCEITLRSLLPKILGSNIRYYIRSFQGNQDLLKQLPKRLRGYQQQRIPDLRILVLIDEDRQDCKQLKTQLEKIAHEARFLTRTRAVPGQPHQLVNRIAIEELEAWFFGDVAALETAYPKLKNTYNLKTRKEIKNPDSIAGGTWEALERFLKKVGYYSGGLPKIEVARNISNYMEPAVNNSKSFQVFRNALIELVHQ